MGMKAFARELLEAEKTQQSVAPLSERGTSFSVEDAYQVQLETVKSKVEEGHKIVGKKIGLTSKPMQQLLGVDEPDYGHLFSNMVVENESVIPADRVIQPKVEAEIAFVLKETLSGPNVTKEDVLKATDYVVPSIEIVDSRVKDWKITLADTIADNASSCLYALGTTSKQIEEIDLVQLGMVLYKNGEIVETGVGALAMGHPAECVAWLANKLYEFGESLNAGEVVLSGALSAAVVAEPGDHFTAKLAHLGEVNIRFAKND